MTFDLVGSELFRNGGSADGFYGPMMWKRLKLMTMTVGSTKAQTRNIFTYYSDIGVLDKRWVCRDLALVQSLVAAFRELDLKFPVVRLLVDYLGGRYIKLKRRISIVDLIKLQIAQSTDLNSKQNDMES